TIPDDSNVQPDQLPGVFSLWGGTITGTGLYTLNGLFTGDSSTSISLTFHTDADGGTGVLAFGAHLAVDGEWDGLSNGSHDISGAPFHLAIQKSKDFNGSENRSINTVGEFETPANPAIAIDKVTYDGTVTGEADVAAKFLLGDDGDTITVG